MYKRRTAVNKHQLNSWAKEVDNGLQALINYRAKRNFDSRLTYTPKLRI